MNLVLSASGKLCWKNIRYNRSAGEFVEMIRRFGFTGSVIVVLFIDGYNFWSPRNLGDQKL